MNIVVFLAGLADPKWPLRPPIIADHGQALQQSDTTRILSPFDEAALEIALKIRKTDAGTRISAVVLGDADGDAVVRTVAGFRPDQTFRLDSRELHAWDAGQLGRELASAASSFLADAELILIGREFGDFDNGTLAPCMAEQLGRQYFGLIQDARVSDSKLQLMRETCNFEEWITAASPVLASITNDRRNRLRHPLMKNIVAARREIFQVIAPRTADAEARISLVSAMPAKQSQRARACRMLAGPLENQAGELAAFLRQ
jgi:electron transfer flavoprotein beta subunit